MKWIKLENIEQIQRDKEFNFRSVPIFFTDGSQRCYGLFDFMDNVFVGHTASFDYEVVSADIITHYAYPPELPIGINEVSLNEGVNYERVTLTDTGEQFNMKLNIAPDAK